MNGKMKPMGYVSLRAAAIWLVCVAASVFAQGNSRTADRKAQRNAACQPSTI